MLPYILFIVFILYFFHRRQPKWILWTLIIFAALRYNVGWDYLSYTNIIDKPTTWEKYSFFWRELFRYAHESGFYHVGIVLPNILTYLCIYKGLKELGLSKKNQAGALLVYATWNSLYLGSFSTIRQAFAIGVGFMMFSFIQNRKIVKSLFCYVFAIILHPSAILLVFLYLGYALRNRLNFKWLTVSVMVLIAGIVSLKNVLIAFSMLDMAQYEVYLKMSDNFGGKIIFVNGFLAIYLFIVFFLSNKNLDSVKRQCFFYTLIAIIGNIAIYALGLPNIIARMLSYYMIFMIVILLPSLQVFRQKYRLRVMAVSFLTLYFFVYLFITKPATRDNKSGYLPYRCIIIEQ